MILYRQMGITWIARFAGTRHVCMTRKKMKAGSIVQGIAQDDRKLKYVIPEQTAYRRF